MVKPLVYLAAPYSNGDTVLNIRCQADVYNKLLDAGAVIPLPPLLISNLAHTIHPRGYDEWLKHTIDLLSHCDACLRLPATYPPLNYNQTISTGADAEEAYCKQNKIPVFYDTWSLHEWASHWLPM